MPGHRPAQGLFGAVHDRGHVFDPGRAPRGLPAEVTGRIAEVLRTGMFEPDVLARVATLGITPKAESGAEFAAFIRRDFERSEQLMRIANFQPE
jgi:tripartite-type tricarboxylate transporter receptor subunit TctC